MTALQKTVIFIALTASVVFHSFAQAGAADYAVDAARSELVVQLFKGGIAAAIAHNHVIQAIDFSGGAMVDSNDREATSFWVEVRTASFTVDEPDVREKFGFSKEVSDKDRRKIQATMFSAEQLDVETYPTMKFVSTNVETRSEGRYLITGNLTIHGVTKSIVFPIAVEEGDDYFRGSASIDFKQSDFGIEPYSAMFGAVRNQDDAVLHADIFLLRESETETGPD